MNCVETVIGKAENRSTRIIPPRKRAEARKRQENT